MRFAFQCSRFKRLAALFALRQALRPDIAGDVRLDLPAQEQNMVA
jgi:hypothetical protein